VLFSALCKYWIHTHSVILFHLKTEVWIQTSALIVCTYAFGVLTYALITPILE
jgi:hypothetical protein